MLKIIASYKTVTAISIYNNMYYLDIRYNFPHIYDNNLNKMIIANLNNWLLASTKGEYSLEVLKKCIEFYKLGQNQSNVSMDDLETIINNLLTILFNSNISSEISKKFKIETLSDHEIEKLVSKTIERYDENNVSKEFLNRLYKICEVRNLDTVDVIKKWVENKGFKNNDPEIFKNLNDVTDLIAESYITRYPITSSNEVISKIKELLNEC